MSDRSDETGPPPETSGSDGPSDNEGVIESATIGSVPFETQVDPQDATADAIPAGPEPDDTTPSRPETPADTGPAGPVAPPPDHTEPLAHTAIRDIPGDTLFLTATGLTATGRQGPIFTDITVTARRGQVVAICGDGGDGRSSLLLALTGRFPHHGGALEVDGHTKPGQIRRRFTIVQAGPPIRFDPYTTIGACIKETTTVSKGTATRPDIDAWLDRLAVDIDTGDTLGFLPRIDQIRFAIACAAACRTPAIAVDDTDTGLDTCGSERVFEALRTVADAGRLVLAACTRTDPPADTLIDLRGQHRPAPRVPRREQTRNGDHR